MAYRAHPRTAVQFVSTGTLSRVATGTLHVAVEAAGASAVIAGQIAFPDRGRRSYWTQAEVRCNSQPPVLVRIL